jgi:hypothetical protein
VRVESCAGAGSSFVVDLPLESAAEAADAARPADLAGTA